MQEEQRKSEAFADLDELDRREWERQSCELDPQAVSIRFGPGRRLVGEVVDRSANGIGVRLADEPDARIGQEVEAYYQSTTCRAVVRWIQWDAVRDVWRMGLMLVDDQA